MISNLGGSPSSVSCPWCGGQGVRAPGIDAQAGWPTEAEVKGAEVQGAEPAPAVVPES